MCIANRIKNGFGNISSVIVNTAAAVGRSRKDSEKKKIVRKICRPVAKTRFDIFSRAQPVVSGTDR